MYVYIAGLLIVLGIAVFAFSGPWWLGAAFILAAIVYFFFEDTIGAWIDKLFHK